MCICFHFYYWQVFSQSQDCSNQWKKRRTHDVAKLKHFSKMDNTITRKATKKNVCRETTLTGESQFHTSPPRGFEPVTVVAGSKQVSPLDQ